MGDLSQMFPQAAECTPGDSTCFLRTTGCQPGDISCLNTKYMACRAGGACQGTPINPPVTQPTCGGPAGPKCPPLAATATCTTPNDPACEPPALPSSCRTPGDLTSCLSPGALGTDCPPGTRCDPAVAPGPNDQNRVSTTTAPLGEVTPPANAPPPSPEAVAPTPSPAAAVPGTAGSVTSGCAARRCRRPRCARRWRVAAQWSRHWPRCRPVHHRSTGARPGVLDEPCAAVPSALPLSLGARRCPLGLRRSPKGMRRFSSYGRTRHEGRVYDVRVVMGRGFARVVDTSRPWCRVRS